MNSRQRLLATFRGEPTDFVPFAPNIYLWFYYHYYKKSLPAELAHATHPFDVVRHLGGDILARWDTQWSTREHYTAGQYVEEYKGDSGSDEPIITAFNHYPARKTERHRQFITPHGSLSQVWTFTPETGTDFEGEYWWKEWEEYDAVRFMVEATEYNFDADHFRQWFNAVGDDGVVMLNITQSPLKTLHWLAGPQNASLFIMEHPDELQALAKIHEEKALALLEKVVDLPEAQIFISHDNLDSAFYPPYFYTDYCHSFFARAAEIIHQRGKHLMVHACGRSKALLELVGESKIDALEGITPPPMGDVQLGDVRQKIGNKNFTVNGGMDATRLETEADAEATLHAYTKDLFAAMGDKDHFIFASSCSTSPLTPWENLIYFRDAARDYGRL